MRRSTFLSFVTSIYLSLFLVSALGKNIFSQNSIPNVIQRREESLDPLGRYTVAWETNFETEIITFFVTVETTGFVGFGISDHGGMGWSDIFIGGIWPNGTTYFRDCHEIGTYSPITDERQDWDLLSVSENLTHTQMSFSRLLNTCDDQDVAITNATTNFIWSFGPTDRIVYHGPNRGTHAVNILDPPMPDFDLTQFEKWNVHRRLEMPELDTSYWCSIHGIPKFDTKHHVVAFAPFLPTTESRKHTHHFLVYKCKAPEGVDPKTFFGPYVGTPGGLCYEQPDLVPVGHCTSILYVWATGGKPFLMPEHIGYSINEFGLDEYVMFEVHYDNPDVLSGVIVDSGVDIYHTSVLRPFEAGLLTVSHAVKASHMIPPHSVDYTTVGHCSSNCTSSTLPPDGINVFNVLLHSHLYLAKVRQFRNGKELPWLSFDSNFAFDYQQNRPLRTEVKILPGDHISYECVTDTTWTDGVVLAGWSSRNEMCEAFLWYYPRQTVEYCGSFYHNYAKLFATFGIEDVDWGYGGTDPTVISPPELANQTFSQVLNAFPWTQELKDEIENELRFSDHWGSCIVRAEDIMRRNVARPENINSADPIVSYPVFDGDYVPPNECEI